MGIVWWSQLIINPSAPVLLAFQWDQRGPTAGHGSTHLHTASQTPSRGHSTGIDPSLQAWICLSWLAFSVVDSPFPPSPGGTPVKTWKVINKCPLCCRTNTDGIWLTHEGLTEPWAGLGKQASTLQSAAGLCGCHGTSAGQEPRKQTRFWWPTQVWKRCCSHFFEHSVIQRLRKCWPSHTAMGQQRTRLLWPPLVLWGLAGQHGGGQT